MSKVIPILPCVNIKEQAGFFTSLGFEVKGLYTSPNAYLAVALDDIELHFWGSQKNVPLENASMCFVQVDNLDELNAMFTIKLKESTGKVPRSGIPRISKVRDLKEDRRFTLVCPGGNTLYFGTPNNGQTALMRTLENERHAKAFAVVYDLLHSHEEPEKAAKALSAFMRHKDDLSDSDKEKLSVLAAEIEEARKEL